MSKEREALKLALAALESGKNHGVAIDVLRRVLAEQPAQQEPPCKTGSQCTSKCQQCEQPAQQQEPVVCVTYKEVTDTMNALWAGTLEKVQIAEEMKDRKLYTSPPASKPWVGLTDEEIEKLSVESGKATFLNDDEQTDILWFDGDCMSLARAIEAKLREKNAP